MSVVKIGRQHLTEEETIRTLDPPNDSWQTVGYETALKPGYHALYQSYFSCYESAQVGAWDRRWIWIKKWSLLQNVNQELGNMRKPLYTKWTISSLEEEYSIPPPSCVGQRRTCHWFHYCFHPVKWRPSSDWPHSTILNIHHFHLSTDISEVRSKGVKSTFPVLVTAYTSFPITSKEAFTPYFHVCTVCVCVLYTGEACEQRGMHISVQKTKI